MASEAVQVASESYGSGLCKTLWIASGGARGRHVFSSLTSLQHFPVQQLTTIEINSVDQEGGTHVTGVDCSKFCNRRQSHVLHNCAR